MKTVREVIEDVTHILLLMAQDLHYVDEAESLALFIRPYLVSQYSRLNEKVDLEKEIDKFEEAYGIIHSQNVRKKLL